MNEFWMWFWRPIAEFLGTMALIAALLLGCAIVILVNDFFYQRALKKNRKQK